MDVNFALLVIIWLGKEKRTNILIVLSTILSINVHNSKLVPKLLGAFTHDLSIIYYHLPGIYHNSPWQSNCNCEEEK